MQGLGFSVMDSVGIACFMAAWIAYYLMVERTVTSQRSLNRLMHLHRYAWFRSHLARDNRIMDANINASLQNGTAFFASTSLLALGGSLTLLRSSQEMQSLFAELPLGLATTRLAWEVKALGLTVIFAYAFFKFAWSYRLFNYAAILIGAVPERKDSDEETRRLAAWRAASMNTVAGRHFNRGQRAFFFALAYLGWFISAYALIAATACVLYVMWHRQFGSDALAALLPWPLAGPAMTDSDAIARTILDLAGARGADKTICPSEAARSLAGPDEKAWSRLMPAIRRVAVDLMKAGQVEIRRKGRPVDPDDFRGVYRIAIKG